MPRKKIGPPIEALSKQRDYVATLVRDSGVSDIRALTEAVVYVGDAISMLVKSIEDDSSGLG